MPLKEWSFSGIYTLLAGLLVLLAVSVTCLPFSSSPSSTSSPLPLLPSLFYPQDDTYTDSYISTIGVDFVSWLSVVLVRHDAANYVQQKCTAICNCVVVATSNSARRL